VPQTPFAPFTAALVAALTACAAASARAGTPPPPPVPAPAPADAAAVPDPDSIAAALRRASLPSSPKQVTFAWALDEAGSRFNGRGVARYAAPDRFRLDLFSPRGDSFLAAALVDETPRVPPQVEQKFRLPSPALLWAAVGVVRSGSARLVSATDEGGRVTVRYDLGDAGTLEYRAHGGRLDSVRRTRGGGVQETVDLERDAAGALKAARYRDQAAYRTLNLTLESSTDVASFPSDVWSPPGTGR
jgi:hypothetical protein